MPRHALCRQLVTKTCLWCLGRELCDECTHRHVADYFGILDQHRRMLDFCISKEWMPELVSIAHSLLFTLFSEEPIGPDGMNMATKSTYAGASPTIWCWSCCLFVCGQCSMILLVLSNWTAWRSLMLRLPTPWVVRFSAFVSRWHPFDVYLKPGCKISCTQ